MLNFAKSILPRTLFGRSLLILVTPIFLVQMITTYIFFDRHWQKMGDRLAASVANEILLITREIEMDDSDENVARLKRVMQRALDLSFHYRPGRRMAGVFLKKKGVQDPRPETFISQTLGDAFEEKFRHPFDIRVDRDEKWVQVDVQMPRGVLSVVLPERRIFSSSGYVVLLWMVGSSIVLLVIATIFMRNQIRPIRRLAVAAERFGKGRDVPFFKVEGAREVRQAARAFIGMRERLQRQIQQRTAMLAGVSHDLRTPLTRMKLQLEMMGEGADVADLKADLADMERMIEAYLQFARGEGGEELARTDLKDLIEQAAKAANRDGQRVETNVQEGLSFLLRPVAFERCLTNLIGNALKYGQHAWISARRFGDSVEICVDDDGPGIDPLQYDDVFKPFFRGEASRNSRTGGVGLGLPIVKDIVLAHGGQVWLDKSPRGGLRVVIDLPV